jgi:pimeloyl-ACP methyl ester carboxylesterase
MRSNIHTFCAAAVAIAMSIQFSSAAADRTWDVPKEARVIKVRGYDMAYRELGSGVPLILIHGSAVDYRYFAAQMEPMSKYFRVISVSLPHYFPEPWRGDGEFSISEHANDLVEFIRALNSGPAHVVGHSRGGTVALYAAQREPSLIRSLVVAEGGGGMKLFAPEDADSIDRRTIALKAVREKLNAGEIDGGLQIFADYVNGPNSWANAPERLKQSLRDNAWTLTAAERDAASLPIYTCDDAGKLDMPVLLLGAQNSPKQFGATLDRFEKCMKKPARSVVQNSSHSMPRMNPEGFTAAVLEFIRAH